MADPTALMRVTHAQLQSHVDREIAALAGRQHGVVARRQLIALGLGRGAIADIEVDFLWREQRLAVELDGSAVHRTAKLFESDRERDRLLQVAGWRVVRVTWRQLRNHRAAVAADLRALLETS